MNFRDERICFPAGGRANNVVEQLRDPCEKNGGVFGISGRQYEVVLLAMRGYQTPDIAKELHMNPRTVKAYFARMFARFRIPNEISAHSSQGETLIFRSNKKVLLIKLINDVAIKKNLALVEGAASGKTLGQIFFRRHKGPYRQIDIFPQVIELVAAGHPNAAIAFVIGTTELVVKNYLRVIYDLVGCSTRVELAQRYFTEKRFALQSNFPRLE